MQQGSKSPKKKNASSDNIRTITNEIQQVYEDLRALAQEVHHSKVLYGGIMTMNDRYGELIGSLVNEMKSASDIKLKVVVSSCFMPSFVSLLKCLNRCVI